MKQIYIHFTDHGIAPPPSSHSVAIFSSIGKIMRGWLNKLNHRKKRRDKGKMHFNAETAKWKIVWQLRLISLKVEERGVTPERAIHLESCIKAMSDIVKGGWDGRGADPSLN